MTATKASSLERFTSHVVKASMNKSQNVVAAILSTARAIIRGGIISIDFDEAWFILATASVAQRTIAEPMYKHSHRRRRLNFHSGLENGGPCDERLWVGTTNKSITLDTR